LSSSAAPGLIGSETVAILRQGGHEVVAGSPKSGISTITGEGLKGAMADAQVVIDLANSLSFEDKTVLGFFETSAGTFSRRRPQRVSWMYLTLAGAASYQRPYLRPLRLRLLHREQVRHLTPAPHRLTSQ
jgi:hypothetical protein